MFCFSRQPAICVVFMVVVFSLCMTAWSSDALTADAVLIKHDRMSHAQETADAVLITLGRMSDALVTAAMPFSSRFAAWVMPWQQLMPEPSLMNVQNNNYCMPRSNRKLLWSRPAVRWKMLIIWQQIKHQCWHCDESIMCTEFLNWWKFHDLVSFLNPGNWLQ